MYTELNPRQDEYFDYLSNHITGVQRSWNELLSEPFESLYPDDYVEACKSISLHDESKYDDEEFDAYLCHFYPSEGFEDDELAFDYAWLRHQNMNPHHWQYWVLIRDGGEIVPMDMPVSEIANMLCDWHSFSAKDPESTAYNWYSENKDSMILSDNTRYIVEELIVYLQDPLL